MNDDMLLDEERQRLFIMVWERPTQEVARELGISDVALAKRCKKLQVPKPPRGYWARVASGQTPKRPPLPAYREELRRQLLKQGRPTSQILLSKMQLGFLEVAINELSLAGNDISDCELTYNGVRRISPELATKILILIQNRYEKWVSDRPTLASRNGALRSLVNLVDKLSGCAKEQLLIFHQETDDSFSLKNDLAISLRATRDFIERVVQLSRVARKNGLAYVVADLSALEHAWSLARVMSPNEDNVSRLELCVSPRTVWIRADMSNSWHSVRFQSVQLPLRDIAPDDLYPVVERKLPPKIRQSRVSPYADRLKTLQEAQTIYDAISNAAYDIERTIPSEKLALFDKLCFSRQGVAGPFSNARTAWAQLEDDLDLWGQVLESESGLLCRDVLGIEMGDIVVVESEEKLMKLEIEGMDAYSTEERVMFSVWGRRFRKDGMPGKRTEHFTICVDNDLK